MKAVQANNCGKRGAKAPGLTVQDAIDSWLRCFDLCCQASLAPAGLLLDFPEKGRRVFVHNPKSIRE